ncbi:MAG: hypothetical protein QOJ81_1987 [Chloroflexota bacterium]|nr:hypothetical protein [Chloroflexota bacterium]
MNQLSTAERAQIIACLVEGNSIRSTSRLTGFGRNTITRLLVNLGEAVSAFQDRTLRNLTSTRIECDEIWSFVHAKAKNVPEKYAGQYGYGDIWTWTAIDPDTKLIASWLVGWRGEMEAVDFLTDLKGRLANRIQLTTDGHIAYRGAVEYVFGSDIDYAQLIKQYGVAQSEDGSPAARRYSPNKVTGQEVRIIAGDPNPEKISTS